MTEIWKKVVIYRPTHNLASMVASAKSHVATVNLLNIVFVATKSPKHFSFHDKCACSDTNNSDNSLAFIVARDFLS